ncbi:unnamed protein product [Trifolium pratense]|uniref:Uncharacterized protein n=1 Tax=Trifolium pratense TaxID=57577 RepID=A0ACB0LS27_TRIPR|nr:unnamed protein product [Trifolium pratense]
MMKKFRQLGLCIGGLCSDDLFVVDRHNFAGRGFLLSSCWERFSIILYCFLFILLLVIYAALCLPKMRTFGYIIGAFFFFFENQ